MTQQCKCGHEARDHMNNGKGACTHKDDDGAYFRFCNCPYFRKQGPDIRDGMV